MATNPSVEACAASAWTKVATNVQDLSVHPLTHSVGGRTVVFSWTYRLTGGAAPSGTSEQLKVPKSGVSISSSVGVDVYVYASAAGNVRVDEGIIGTYLIDG